jgi:outer membrane beta-barrel protein
MPLRALRPAVLLIVMITWAWVEAWSSVALADEPKPPDQTPPAETKPADKPSADGTPSDKPPPIAPCLDEENNFKGVQEKTFLKRRRLELIGQGGVYASDLLSSTYTYGGSAAFYLTEDIGIEGTFAVTPVALDVDSSLSNFFGDSRFKSETGYLILAGLIWSPIHYKIRVPGGGIVHGDIELALGGGKMFSRTSQGFAYHTGVLMEVYLLKWLSFRLDIRDVMLIQEVVGETRLTNNITALGGIALWFPFGF